MKKEETDMSVIDKVFLRRVLPIRDAEAHKGCFGHAYLLVGSSAYPGAAALAAEAALYMGAGYVTLLAPPEVCRIALTRTPSLLASPCTVGVDTTSKIKELCKPCFTKEAKSSLLIGCGLGKEPALLSLLYRLFETEGAPLCLDADALNLLAEDRRESLPLLRAARREILLTPHPLEFARLAGVPVAAVQEDRAAYAAAFAAENRVHVLLKGYGTVLAAKDGRVYVNRTGGPALAKAGSGDVLAGAIASLTAMGVPLPEAAAASAYLHGAAGDRLAERFSVHGVLPSQLPMEMARVLREALASPE